MNLTSFVDSQEAVPCCPAVETGLPGRGWIAVASVAIAGILVGGILGTYSAKARASAGTDQPTPLLAFSARAKAQAGKCGRKYLFRRPFSIAVAGKQIPCKLARRILASHCRIRFNRQWSCLSLRGSEPFLVWFPTAEIFEFEATTEIRLWRYPCSEAVVTPDLFMHHSSGFPTRRQMLADDLIRCKMLQDASIQEVEGLIGPPDESSNEDGNTYLYYFLGPERDSLVQIDPELLEIEISDERVDSVLIFQG